MDLMHHQMPRERFEALARGGGGTIAIRELTAAQLSKHLILLRGVFETARPVDRFTVAGYELLAKAQRRDPFAAGQVISYPSVGAWALRTLRGDQTPSASRHGTLACVAAAAAIRAGLDEEVEVPVTGGVVMLPGLGAADASGPVATVRTSQAEVASGGRRVRLERGAPGWHELRRVRAGALDVLVDDLDPFRMPSAGDLASRLTEAETTEWGEMLADAWPVLAPDSAAEVASVTRAIVPCSLPGAGHVSSSSPETFGTVAMSRQPDRYTCAVTLIHEVQHLKLSALLDLVQLTLPDDGQRYYAPWRTDARPASSVLQGSYAFMGVTGFWRGLRENAEAEVRLRAHAEFARWREGAWGAANTLQASGQLTPAGESFVAEMAQVLAAWRSEPVPGEALSLARDEADAHLTRWRDKNGTTQA